MVRWRGAGGAWEAIAVSGSLGGRRSLGSAWGRGCLGQSRTPARKRAPRLPPRPSQPPSHVALIRSARPDR